MKKILICIFCLLLILPACGKESDSEQPIQQPIQKENKQNLLESSQRQINNFTKYSYSDKELLKIKRWDENNELYYYAADGKRYLFPDQEIFRSWFSNYDISKFEEVDLETLYKTPLGGNVTLRPGCLLQTPTDPTTYFVRGNGEISPINQKIIEEINNSEWQINIFTLPNFYFANYKRKATISSFDNFPRLFTDITINKDKGLK